MVGVVKTGAVPGMLESSCVTKDHLKSLAEMLDIALTRSFLVLERLGYEPNKPPPDTPQAVH
jgi:hypothetical protein